MNGSGPPLKNLLFNFCLAALEGDSTDAKLYLNYFYFVVCMKRSLYCLSVIISEPTLNEDKGCKANFLHINSIIPQSAKNKNNLKSR